MPEGQAKDRGLEPLGYLRSYAYAGCDPREMGLGPVHALARLMRDTGVRLTDFDLIEINEAFAAQVIACERAMADGDYCRQECGLESAIGEIDRDRLNIDGGAIAVGHPVGTTGARLVLTMLKKLRRENKNSGLATLCVGGGQGAALHLEVA
jgi:acetyl-CoA acetyltransferase